MSSKYQPQLFGWFADLDKGTCYRSELDKELIYTNNTFCMIARLNSNSRLKHGILFSLALILCLFFIVGTSHSFIYKYFLYLDYNSYLRIGNDTFILAIIMNILFFIANYCFIIPELFSSYFSPKDSPIVFNRKTNKAYINESVPLH
ncbi:hypothetical protein RHO12_11725 [Orbus sturtevantii]|uniref:hypothetical protein n=1 Tax=Orbus sturtevantii TaxID=3074109 RepID=UPI00370DAF2E